MIRYTQPILPHRPATSRLLGAYGTLSSAKQEQGHRVKQNKAGIDLARSQVRMARLNLSYTVITATADGVVGKKQIHEGQLVQPGQTLVDIVDNTDLWVVANFRETQMPHISVGEKGADDG